MANGHAVPKTPAELLSLISDHSEPGPHGPARSLGVLTLCFCSLNSQAGLFPSQPHLGLTSADSTLSSWSSSEIRSMDHWPSFTERWMETQMATGIQVLQTQAWVGIPSHTGIPVQKAISPGTGLIPRESNLKNT